MAENVRFSWSNAKLKAAALIADGMLGAEQIAAQVGFSVRQLQRWREDPEFAEKVEQFAKDIEAAVLRVGIGRRANRLRAMNDRWERLNRIMEERAAEKDRQDIPGWKTGLLLLRLKGLGSGDAFEIVEEVELDVALLRELRELEGAFAKDADGADLAARIEELEVRAGIGQKGSGK